MKSSSALQLYLFALIFCSIFYIYIVQRFIELDKEPEVYGWERHRSRNVSRYILPSEDSAILKPKDLCQQNTFLRIFVVSDVKNFHRRKIIRETWGNEKKVGYHTFMKIHSQTNHKYLNMSETWKGKPIHFKIVFILGKDTSMEPKYQEQVVKEAELYNDILQEDFVEHYSNLTLKSLYILKWASKPCLSYSSK